MTVQDNLPARLGVKQAQAYSGITRSRLFLYLAEGRLTACKAGRQTLIDRESVDRLLASLPTWDGRNPRARRFSMRAVIK